MYLTEIYIYSISFIILSKNAATIPNLLCNKNIQLFFIKYFKNCCAQISLLKPVYYCGQWNIIDKLINSVHISVNRCKPLKYTLHFGKLMNFTNDPQETIIHRYAYPGSRYPRKCPIWLLIGIRRQSRPVLISARDSHFWNLYFFQYVTDAYIINIVRTHTPIRELCRNMLWFLCRWLLLVRIKKQKLLIPNCIKIQN